MSEAAYVARLDEEPLVEILAKVAEYAVPARIECTHRGSTLTLYCESSELIFACEGDPHGSLRETLEGEGLIDGKTFDELQQRAARTTRPLAVELAEAGIDGIRLLTAARAVTLALLDRAIAMDQGEVRMTPGRHSLPVTLSIPLGRVILDGVRGHGEPKVLTGKIGSRTTVFRRTERAAPWLTQDENDLLDEVDGKKSFAELTAVPPGPAIENVRRIYAFWLLKLVAPKQTVKVKMKMNE